MKKLILLSALFFGLVIVTNAQSKQAEFKFEKETHDFGKIAINKPAVTVFNFVNVGDQPLIITKVEATCGCTVPEYTKVPVKKGETGSIKVTYNPTGQPLPFSKNVTITSNAKTPVKVLYIKGETVAAGASTTASATK
ncbi:MULTISPECIES: DUF1573 domain-containing protein [Pedobacter]|uniref:DUF1573 domain-containing protein n=1 Tax=Pedobacter TaxID=84567 RepID=UPI00210AA0DC|nr:MULTISPECIES: DUF1573 domain-containing protein [unclassified Pedobacter]